MIRKLIVLALVLLVGCPAIFLPVVSGAVSTIPATAVSGTVPTIPATALAASDAAPKPQLDYRVSLAPNQIWDGTIEYFKSQGFTTVVLVAAEPLPYKKSCRK